MLDLSLPRTARPARFHESARPIRRARRRSPCYGPGRSGRSAGGPADVHGVEEGPTPPHPVADGAGQGHPQQGRLVQARHPRRRGQRDPVGRRLGRGGRGRRGLGRGAILVWLSLDRSVGPAPSPLPIGDWRPSARTLAGSAEAFGWSVPRSFAAPVWVGFRSPMISAIRCTSAACARSSSGFLSPRSANTSPLDGSTGTALSP
jgi:hypothetical protein